MTTLADFKKEQLSFAGKAKEVFSMGAGPGVVIMPEMPGITPEVAAFGVRVAEAGFTVFIPDLFGVAGKEFSNGYVMQSMAKACVSKEFAALATNKKAPVTDWLRGLVGEAHTRCGGQVGVVGMCFTGGFALALAVDPAVEVATMSQPALPFPIGAKARRSSGVSDAELKIVKERAAKDQVCVIGLRFTGDTFVPAERFENLRAELGDAFIGVEIDSSKGNAHGFTKQSHSVLTMEYRDEPGFPTNEAHDLVIKHFKERLGN